MFPLRLAHRAYLITGSSRNFIVSGDCVGTSTRRSSPPVAAAFGNAGALAVTSSSSFSLSGCVNPPAGTVSTQYFDSSYRLLGAIEPGGSYGVYDAAVALPEFVSAGDGGTLGTEALYTDATRSVSAGRAVFEYSIAADTATTVLTRFTVTAYDNAGQVSRFETTTYRLGADGSFGIANFPVVFSTNTLRLLLTPQ